MSAEVVARLAARWGCTVPEVWGRIGARLKAAGLVAEDATASEWNGSQMQTVIRIGVTDDDQFAVVDRDGEVVLWLTDGERS